MICLETFEMISLSINFDMTLCETGHTFLPNMVYAILYFLHKMAIIGKRKYRQIYIQGKRDNENKDFFANCNNQCQNS